MLSYLNSCFKNFKYISFIFLYLFCFSDQTLANEQNKNLENVYKLLQEKNFKDGLKELQILCEDNNIQAQLLFSKILLATKLALSRPTKILAWPDDNLFDSTNFITS